MNHSALCICIGADVHLDEIVLCVVDKADGHEVTEHFRVTNNLPGAQAAALRPARGAHGAGRLRLQSSPRIQSARAFWAETDSESTSSIQIDARPSDSIAMACTQSSAPENDTSKRPTA